MNVLQARRLAGLFDEACPPPALYSDEPRTVDIGITAYHGNDLELRFLCPETTLVRWAPSLYVCEDGRLRQYDDDLPGTDEDRMVRVGLTWSYLHDRSVWALETYRLQPVEERSAA